MDHTLKLEVPDELYQRLVKSAHQAGRLPEQLAADLLRASGENLSAEDPLLLLAGSFESGVRDVSEGHDHYLGQCLMQELSPGGDG